MKLKCGVAKACGILLAYFGMLRSAELIKIRGGDVILRNRFARTSTIRLGKTKLSREERVQFGGNAVAERAFRFALQLAGYLPAKPSFGFKKYGEMCTVARDFNAHFGVSVHLTPHSLRAGGATFYKMHNMSLGEISLTGRWSGMGTAKSYIDVVHRRRACHLTRNNRRRKACCSSGA